ncbi:MAG: hypothetical protein ACLSHC_05040 [Bilophila wadsworthia]
MVLSEQRDIPSRIQQTAQQRSSFPSLPPSSSRSASSFSKQALRRASGALPLAFYRNAIFAGIWAVGLAFRPSAGVQTSRPTRHPQAFPLGCLFGPASIWLVRASISSAAVATNAHRASTHRPAYHHGIITPHTAPNSSSAPS